MSCSNCQGPITGHGKKFCSRSCSAAFNNKSNPRRKRQERFCSTCGISLGVILSQKTLRCEDCKLRKLEESRTRVSTMEGATLAQVKGSGTANNGSRYPYIRNLSRKKYLSSGLPMECLVCGYDFHVEICHIKAVSDHEETARISEVNSLSNLIPLCRNHHWEFDHGLRDQALASIAANKH